MVLNIGLTGMVKRLRSLTKAAGKLPFYQMMTLDRSVLNGQVPGSLVIAYIFNFLRTRKSPHPGLNNDLMVMCLIE